MGKVVASLPRTFRSVSGLLPSTVRPSNSRKNMYGEGFSSLNAA